MRLGLVAVPAPVTPASGVTNTTLVLILSTRLTSPTSSSENQRSRPGRQFMRRPTRNYTTSQGQQNTTQSTAGALNLTQSAAGALNLSVGLGVAAAVLVYTL
ncbi:hypothetical protein CspHIS471_0505710 [Cutaneotrichosporon sp. HIS471]|nr:hypothetical protein CspHIS471_0505710 [Cutaneotrichosporon sp. HIS471]